MSETFFIKNTTFNDNNDDSVEREANSFVIEKGELNGPGLNGVGVPNPRNSDITLYGFGAIKWGENVNQNLLRMLENFACPAKVDGDFLVGTDSTSTYIPAHYAASPYTWLPGNGSFVESATAIPKDEYDLGDGNGITHPVLGQYWFNTTNDLLYVYANTGWFSMQLTAQRYVDSHEANTDLHLTSNQNTFLDSLNLPSLTSAEVNTLIGIRTDTTIQTQLNSMVEKTGDTMTGDLILTTGTDILFEGGHHRITSDAGDDFNVRVGHKYDVGDVYTQTGGAIHLHAEIATTNPYFRIKIGDGIGTGETIGTPVTFTGIFDFKNDGQLSINGLAPTTGNHATRKDYVDDNFMSLSGGTLNVGANITFSGGGKIIGLPLIPTLATSATSKAYVTSYVTTIALSTKALIDSQAFTGVPEAPTQLPTDNSTRIATTAFAKTAVTNKAPLDSPSFTGYPKAPTQPPGDNSTNIATTGFIAQAIASKANETNASLGGDVRAVSPSFPDSSARIATTEFVQLLLANYPNRANPTFTTAAWATTPTYTPDASTKIATTALVYNKLAAKLLLDSGHIYGYPRCLDAIPVDDNTDRIATTEFVHSQAVSSSNVGIAYRYETPNVGSPAVLVVPAGVGHVLVRMCGGGGGGGGAERTVDGDNIDGDDGYNGTTSQVYIEPSNHTHYTIGGRGGRAKNTPTDLFPREDTGGYGVSHQGALPYSTYTTWIPGGDGGNSEMGLSRACDLYAEIQPAATGGAGGAGARSHPVNNRAGEGGESGKVYFLTISVSEGDQLTITVGEGGKGGNWQYSPTARVGGKGGDGVVEITWLP